jgi:N-acetyl-alpha-D-glucosaminyl L-malate synthase BshA
VTAVSSWLRDRTREAFGITKEIEVIPNFIDGERFSPDRRPSCKGSFVREDRKVIMHASNFRPVKNIPGVIETFRLISEKIPAHLVLIGDGPELPTAHALVRSLGLDDSVFFLGSQEAIEDLLVQTDLLLQPSRHESFGLTALEAMASGVPVVLTNQGGTVELIESGVSGFLADPDDVEGMAACAVEVLGDRDRWNAVSKAARLRALGHFGEEKIVDRYLEFYRRILS